MNENCESTGAWSKEIEVLIGSSGDERRTVDAFIVDKLAVHESISDPYYHAVTHIKSGCIIALFSSGMTATNYASDVQRIIDFDAYVEAIIKNGKKAAEKAFAPQLAAAKKLRAEYGDVRRLDDSDYSTISRKELSKAVKP